MKLANVFLFTLLAVATVAASALKLTPLPTLETAGATVPTKLAEAVAYAGLRPFSKEEGALPCVAKATALAHKLDGIARDSAEAQAMYDHDPTSEVGREAEKNIKTLEFLATQVAKFYHKATVACANFVATHRAAAYAVAVNRTTAQERDERDRLRKTYRDAYEDSPKMNEERRKVYDKALELEADAKRELEALKDDIHIDPMLRTLMTDSYKARRDATKRAEQHVKDPAHDVAGAAYAKQEATAKRAAEQSHKARVRATAEENAKLTLKEHLTDAVAAKLKAARTAYDRRHDRQASEQLQKVAAAKRFELQPHGPTKDAAELVCDQHLHDRMVRFQKLVARTAGHVQQVAETMEALHGKHLAEVTMLVAAVRAQQGAERHL